MLTVCIHWLSVEASLLGGALACPGCDGALSPWGHARRRRIGTLTAGMALVLRPRRAICSRCGITHVLLPANLLARRGVDVAVIGTALTLAAHGRGCETIARTLARPVGTVRAWIRRARSRAVVLRAALAAWVTALDPDPPATAATGSAWGDAVAMLAAVHRAVLVRWPGAVMDSVPLWHLAVVLTNASLLAPALSVRMINTNRPLAALRD
jgi:hypothetical protein